MNQEIGQIEFIKNTHYPIEARRASFQLPTFKKHFHETYSIGLVEQGTSQFVWQRGCARLQPGNVVLLNPGETHVCNPQPGTHWTYRMFYIDPSWVEANLIPAEFTTRLINIPVYYSNLCCLYETLKASAALLETDSRLIDTLSSLFQNYGTNTLLTTHTQPSRSLQIVHDYLIENYTANVSLSELANLAGLSQYHLLRSFRDRYGVPPHTYLNLQRIRRAKEMLRSDQPLSSIATSLGFSDQSHFNRVFKTVVGIPPGAYQLICR